MTDLRSKPEAHDWQHAAEVAPLVTAGLFAAVAFARMAHLPWWGVPAAVIAIGVTALIAVAAVTANQAAAGFAAAAAAAALGWSLAAELAGPWEKSYRQKTEDLVIPFLGDIRLPELNEDDIRAWHRHLKRELSPRTGRPRSPTTVNQAHRILSSALKVAVIEHRMARNPASLVRPPARATADPEPPSEDEVMAILAECEDRRSGPRWVTAIGTGLRQGEALGLLWPHVDLADTDAASLAVEWEMMRLPWKHGCENPHDCGQKNHRYPCVQPCPKIRPSGRPHTCRRRDDPKCCPPDCTAHAASCPRRHGGGLRLKRPKTEKSRAAIPLVPYAAAALKQWRTDQKAERLAHPSWTGWAHTCDRRLRPRELVCPDCMLPTQPGLLVFAQPDGLPLDPRADWQEWSDLLDGLGLPHYGTHANRHGLATALLEEGEDIAVVAELMRHTNPDFTRRAYQHVRPKLKRAAASKMDARMRRR